MSPIQRPVLHLKIHGLGIVFFSPYAVEQIAEGDDYLAQYADEASVQPHIQRGDLVGFGTGSPGAYSLRLLEGYPTEERLKRADFKLRLGLVVRGGEVHFRDLYDLMDWRKDTPPNQVASVTDGIYHVTLCSDRPASGRLGDDQAIEVYLAPLTEFPRLDTQGVPSLVLD